MPIESRWRGDPGGLDQPPSLPVPEPVNDATLEKQIPFRRKYFCFPATRSRCGTVCSSSSPRLWAMHLRNPSTTYYLLVISFYIRPRSPPSPLTVIPPESRLIVPFWPARLLAPAPSGRTRLRTNTGRQGCARVAKCSRQVPSGELFAAMSDYFPR